MPLPFRIALSFFACVALTLSAPLRAWASQAGMPDEAATAVKAMQAQMLTSQETTGNTAGPDFSLSITPPPDILYRGTHVSLTTIAVAVGGYNGPIKLSIDGTLPSWLQLSFTPASIMPIEVKPTWNPSVASQLYVDATFVPTVKVGSNDRGKGVVLAFLPFLLLMPAALRKRTRQTLAKRRLAPLLAIPVLACLTFVTGCGEGRYPPVVPAGVYLVNIVATGATGQQHTVPLLLRIGG